MKQGHLFRHLSLAGCLMALGWIAIPRDGPPAPRETPLSCPRRARPQALKPHDFGEKFRRLAGEKDSIRRDAGLREISAFWIAAHPAEALDFASRLPPGEVKDSFLRQLLLSWAEHDAAAALAWTDRLDEGRERRHARSVIAFALAENDPLGALELALLHGADEDGSGGLLENLAMQWAARDPGATLAWVRDQPGGKWHDCLMARVAFILSKSDPHAAACHVAEEMEPGPVQTEAILSVLHQWVLVDPPGAAGWIEGFPSGNLRERALGELAGRLTTVDETGKAD